MGLAIVVFVTTNVDDILLLAAFFANRTFRPRSIVIGQFAGIAALTAMSAVAALLAVAIPEGWIGLLGVVPLGLGLQGLYSLWSAEKEQDDDDLQAAEVPSRTAHSQWIAVALVTIANGGDNLGVYIPLFSRELAWVPVYVIVFTVLTGLWCMLGYWLVHHPVIGARIRRYGHVVLPLVLIGLGVFILTDLG
jgi:cadmium resistance protein CadD (predicted permease)